MAKAHIPEDSYQAFRFVIVRNDVSIGVESVKNVPGSRIAIERLLESSPLAKVFHENVPFDVYVMSMDLKRAGTATISVEGLKAGATVEVVDEARRLTAQAGRFSDAFEPLAEHVYRIRP